MLLGLVVVIVVLVGEGGGGTEAKKLFLRKRKGLGEKKTTTVKHNNNRLLLELLQQQQEFKRKETTTQEQMGMKEPESESVFQQKEQEQQMTELQQEQQQQIQQQIPNQNQNQNNQNNKMQQQTIVEMMQTSNQQQKMQMTATLPPDFWMWETTPAPPAPLMPNPHLVWIEATAPPLPTTAPSFEACYGCDCLFLFAEDGLIEKNTVSNDFTCIGGAAKFTMPAVRWAGMPPKNTGVGHPILHPNDGSSMCPKSMSYALVVEDLDYPYGLGERHNKVLTHFWAVNIPGNWQHFDETVYNDKDKNFKNGMPIVFIGKNDETGKREMAPVCPKKGLHRYRFTVWVLRDYLSDGDNPLDPELTYNDILPRLESLELARSSFYGNVKADPTAFLGR